MVRRSFLQKLWPAQSPEIESLVAAEPLARLRAGTGAGQVLTVPKTSKLVDQFMQRALPVLL